MLVGVFDFDPLNEANSSHSGVVQNIRGFHTGQLVHRASREFTWRADDGISWVGAWVWFWPSGVAADAVVRVATERGTAKFDLSLFAGESPEGLRVSCEYCTELFEEATISRMLEHFEVLLESIVADPTRAVSELALLSDAERHQVLSNREVVKGHTAASPSQGVRFHPMPRPLGGPD